MVFLVMLGLLGGAPHQLGGKEVEPFLFKPLVAGLAGLCQRSIGIEFGDPATFEFGQPFGSLEPDPFCFFGFALLPFGDVTLGKDASCFLAFPDSLPVRCEPSAAPCGVSGLCWGATGLCGLLCVQAGLLLCLGKSLSGTFMSFGQFLSGSLLLLFVFLSGLLCRDSIRS